MPHIDLILVRSRSREGSRLSLMQDRGASPNQLAFRSVTRPGALVSFWLCGPRPLAEFRRPPLLHRLPAPAEGEGVGRHVDGDHRAGADIGVGADGHRRDEGRVGADEGPLPDHRAVLAEPIVIASDGAGADIGAGADGRIAEIGEVVDLRAGAELDILDLDEVADAGIGAEMGPGPQPRERPDADTLADMR